MSYSVLEDDEVVEAVDVSLDEPDSFFVEVDSDEVDLVSESLDFAAPLAEADDDRESVMYQPLPLKTMPTG